jgi:hypothetical protein
VISSSACTYIAIRAKRWQITMYKIDVYDTVLDGRKSS